MTQNQILSDDERYLVRVGEIAVEWTEHDANGTPGRPMPRAA